MYRAIKHSLPSIMKNNRSCRSQSNQNDSCTGITSLQNKLNINNRLGYYALSSKNSPRGTESRNSSRHSEFSYSTTLKKLSDTIHCNIKTRKDFATLSKITKAYSVTPIMNVIVKNKKKTKIQYKKSNSQVVKQPIENHIFRRKNLYDDITN